MVLIMVCGHIDLSVGSVIGFCGAVIAYLLKFANWNIVPALIVTILCGSLVGIWQGFWIGNIHIPPFICTLAGMFLFRGLGRAILDSKTVAINNEYMEIQGKKLIKEANAIWMVRQDYDGAEKALDILSKVNPLAGCSIIADSLMESMSKKLREDEKKEAERQERIEQRNWDFMVMQYKEMMSLYRKEEDNEAMLMDRMIEAAENVGCAYGENQPQIICNTNYIEEW